MSLDFLGRFCVLDIVDRVKEEDRKRLLNSFEIPLSKNGWRVFIGVMVTSFGAILLLSGILLFITANWESLGKFFKFFMVESAILLSILFWFISKNRFFAQISLTVAAILIGGLLALIGQVYQSSADSWELFFYWSILGFAWVVVNYFAPLWIFWIFLMNLTLFLYFEKIHLFIFLFHGNIFLLLAILNLTLLILFELADRFLNYKIAYVKKVLVNLNILFMTISIFSIDSSAIFFIFYAFWFGLMFMFLYQKLEIASLGSLLLSLNIYILFLIGKFLLLSLRVDSVLVLFILSVASITTGYLSINFIKNLKGERDDLQ